MKNMERNLPAVNLHRTLDFFIQLILILILIISPFLFGSVKLFAITIIELGALLILLLWLFKLLSDNSFEFVKIPINITIALFLIFVAAQYVFINSFVGDFTLGEVYKEAIKGEALKLFSYLIFFYAVLHNFKSKKSINRLIGFLIFVGLTVSLVGIIQKLSGAEKIFGLYEVTQPLYFFSSFGNRNHFASYMNMIIFLTMGITFSYFPFLRSDIKDYRKERVTRMLLAASQKWTWLYLFGLVIMSTSLFFAVSRGGILSFLCGVIIFLVLIFAKRLTKKGYLALILVLILMFGMLVWFNALGQIAERFGKTFSKDTASADRLLGSRKIEAGTVINLIKTYPVVGVGFGAFRFIYNKGYKPDFFEKFYVSHSTNNFLEFFSEVGSIGFAIFFITACLYLSLLVKMIFKRRDPFVVGIGIGTVASLSSMCIHSLFDFNFHIPSNAVLFFVISGLALTVSSLQLKGEKEVSELPKFKFPLMKNTFLKLLMSLVLIVAFFYIARIITTPYIAYRISERGKTDIHKLSEAVRLDPMNAEYHYLLARVYVEKASPKFSKRKKYIAIAVKEMEEAIRLNPWSEVYSEYLDRIKEAFRL